LEGVGEIYVV